MRIKLHIGLPKTGTTHLQQNMFVHREALRDRGVVIPMAGVYQLAGAVVPAHHPLCWALQEDREFPAHEKDMIEGSWERLRTELHVAQEDATLAIISSESFYWELRSADDIRHLRENFGSFEVDVVLVLRDVIRFSESMYGQYVARYGFTGGPLEFVADHLPMLQFGKQIERWKSVFGQSNLQVVGYESFDRKKYFSQFMRYLGVDAVADLTPSWEEEYQNFSIDREFIPLIRRLNGTPAARDAVAGLLPYLLDDGSGGRRVELFDAAENRLLRAMLDDLPDGVIDKAPVAL
jgi:hypothetical protein